MDGLKQNYDKSIPNKLGLMQAFTKPWGMTCQERSDIRFLIMN